MSNDVSTLPKLGGRAHSSLGGTLSNFQGQLSEQFLRIIGKLQNQIKEISCQCIQQLDDKMKFFGSKRKAIVDQQMELINNISKSDEQFESLRSKLNELSQRVFSEFAQIKEESLQLYGNSYLMIKPFIADAQKESEDIINQIPPNVAERLQHEITRFNTNYLQTKQTLLKQIYMIDIEVNQQQKSLIEDFEKKKEAWNTNQFNSLFSKAKEQLKPTAPIDYTELYNGFYEDQKKFNNCFRKQLTNVSLISPPDHFSDNDIKNWWKEVEDLLQCHSNFIKQFENKFQEKLNSRIESNNNLISQLEKELVELKDNVEAQAAMDELTPLCKINQQVNVSFFEKIQKYWEYRSKCLEKCFESIRDFYQSMVQQYTKYVDSLADRSEKEMKNNDSLRKMSDEKLAKFETTLNDTMERISLLVSDQEIDDHVKACNKLLSQIETEYRTYFDKMNQTYEEQPQLVLQIFEDAEESVLDILKIKKTAESTEIPSFSVIFPSSRNKNQKGKGNSTGGNGANNVANNNKRSNRKPLMKQNSKNLNNSCGEPFTIKCGAKFTPFEKLVVIPNFDDFFDTQVAPLPSGRGGRGRGRAAQSVRAKRGLAGKPGSANSRGGRGKNAFEIDESEIPDYSLNDFIPKFEGKIAIWVCIPTSDDFSEWLIQFRISYMNCIYDLFKSNLTKSLNEENKAKLTEELTEKLRTHNPRFHLIELNVAEARKLQISSRRDQLESHFQRITKHFNSLFSKLKNNFGKTSEVILNDCKELRQFVTGLSNIKNSHALTLQTQEFHIFERQFLNRFENQISQQEKAIEEFFVFFKAKNDRFKDVAVNQDNSYSDDERQMAINYFDKMDHQTENLRKTMKNDLTNLKTKAEQSRQSIVTEYEACIPFHQIDLTFLENILACHFEFKQKYESLFFHNRHQEQDIHKCLENIDLLKDKVGQPQEMINEIFNTIETLRVKIIKRSVFLCQLKSNIPPDTQSYKIELAEEVNPAQVKKATQQQQSSPPVKKGSSNTSNSSKSRSGSRSHSRNAQQRKDDSSKQAQTTGMSTIVSRLESLKTEFFEKLNKLSVEYYLHFKTRKFEITRPNEIPINQQEFMNKINGFWAKLTDSFQSLFDDSVLRFRFQVSFSLDKAKDMESLVFLYFRDYYLTKVLNEREEIQKQFDQKMSDLTKERVKNQSFLGLKMADANDEKTFEATIESEKIRTFNEMNMINEYKQKVIECETKIVQDFISHLPVLTTFNLLLFDKFILIEDLIGGSIPNATRKTMTEIMKENERHAKNPVNVNERPFYQRTWPKIHHSMTGLAHFDSTPIEIEPIEDNIKDKRSSSKSRDRKKRSTKPEKTEKKETKGRNIRPDSNQPSARKQKSSRDRAGKQLDVLKSLETPIHRNVIIEQNRSFSGFNSELEKRATQFNEYVKALIQENDNFTKYWQKSVVSLRPSYQFKLKPLPQK